MVSMASTAVRETCVPPIPEHTRPIYAYAGVHKIPSLRAWWTEIPKSASTTLARFLNVSTGGITYGNGPENDEVNFAVVRNPGCRFVSAFMTAYSRAVMHANTTHSPCPFSRFPYLVSAVNTTLDYRIRLALDTLEHHGSSLADKACGHAYHHMLSQTFFVWPRRLQLLFDTDKGRPPRATVFLRLESLHEDMDRFCRERHGTTVCEKLRAQVALGGALERRNPTRTRTLREWDKGNESYATLALQRKLSDSTLEAINRVYASDFACFGYEAVSRRTRCV